MELSSPHQVHAVYLLPADGVDQYASFAGRIAADAAAIDTWWRRQDPSRAPRFDRFPFPGCSAPFADLDVGFLRLPRPGSDYLGDEGDLLLSDLGRLDQLSTAKLLLYYDGPPVFGPRVCGTAFIPSAAVTRLGGAHGLAFVWIQSACAGDVGAGRLAAAVAAHELLHSLGALTEPGAPNACPPLDSGHVCDADSDVLFPTASPATTLDGQVLDVNRDDYYGHQGTWFDVQDSPWLLRLPQFTLSVQVTATAGASGRVELVEPTSAPCPHPCSFRLDAGTEALLAATAAPGSRFLGWAGACTGRAACAVVLDSDQEVTAGFGPTHVRLTVTVRGRGIVASSSPRLRCPGRCSAAFPAGRTVRLRAIPALGFRFLGWAGACTGRAACSVRLDRDRRVLARFVRL